MDGVSREKEGQRWPLSDSVITWCDLGEGNLTRIGVSRLKHQHSIYTEWKGNPVSSTSVYSEVPTCCKGNQGAEMG